MPLILPGNVATATAATGYDVANSCRFNDGDSAYMHKTPSSDGNRRTFTFSFWVKRGELSSHNPIAEVYSSGENVSQFYFNATDQFTWYESQTSNKINLTTNAVQRDPNAWYHIVVKVDTTESTNTDRVKIYINNELQTITSGSNTYPDQNFQSYMNSTHDAIEIGRTQYNSNQFDGYLAEVCMIDGSALAPSSFGEADEDSPTIWKPIDVSGLTFGTNGFYLDFEDSANLGNDANGGTDLTEVNLAATDQMTDSPTNNFATWSPLAYTGKTAMEEGNLQGYGDNNDSHNDGGIATIGVSTGKWYWENKITAVGGSVAVGIFPNTVTVRDGVDMFAATNSIYYKSNGKKQVSDSASNYGDSYTTNDIIGVALNLDDNEIKFYKNGTVQNSGTAISVTSISDFYFPVQAGYTNSHVTANFGNPPYANSSDAADENGYGAFEYAPPSGYLALCTKNLGSDGG